MKKGFMGQIIKQILPLYRLIVPVTNPKVRSPIKCFYCLEEAENTCLLDECGKSLCSAHTVEVLGTNMCPDCINERMNYLFIFIGFLIFLIALLWVVTFS